MKMWLVALIALTPLIAGCADDVSDNSDIAGVKLERDSETCRAAAATGVGTPSVDAGKTANEKNATFEQSYHACMASHGYTIASASP